MLNPNKHKVILIEILKDIYDEPELRTILGFKGGTAAMIFYDLPRFSVDLDFDLLDIDKKEIVFGKIKNILDKHGILRQAIEKRFTLFFLLSYEKSNHAIKVEISKRKSSSSFHLKSYLGVQVLIMKEEDMLANKLSALLTRSKFAMRDVFDVWFFMNNKWSINESVFTEKTGLSIKRGLEEGINKISKVKKADVLHGLGELLTEKQKIWVREKLLEEAVFYLRLYKGNP